MSVLQRIEKMLLAPGGVSGPQAVESILVLSGLLKQQCYLSDVTNAIRLLALLFHDADNFMRSTIVQALKVVGPFEFPESSFALLAPIVRVLDSNDPVARGLTLQALGHLCNIIRHHDDIHFRVLDRLSSPSLFETECALFCIAQLAALSRPFAAAVLRSAPALLADETSGNRFKLGLVRVLGVVKHDEDMSATARALCMSFMAANPREDIVIASLLVLSQIAGLHLESHVDFLWQNFFSDPRPRVRLTCVRCLFRLALRSPFHGNHRPSVIVAVLAQQNHPVVIQTGLLALFAVLARHWRAEPSSVALVALDTSSLAPLLVSPDVRVRCWALRALSGAASLLPASAQQLLAHLTTVFRDRGRVIAVRDPVLAACVDLCSPEVAKHSPDIVSKVMALLLKGASESADNAYALMHAVSVCAKRAGAVDLDALFSLAQAHLDSAGCFAAALIAFFRSAVLVGPRGSLQVDLGKFGTLLQQTEGLCVTTPAWRWAWYCVAREAAVAGFHFAASKMFFHLVQFPETDRSRSWLQFLSELSQAEMQAQTHHIVEAALIMHRASVTLVGCGPPVMQPGSAQAAVQTSARTAVLMFQKRYCKWRLGMLEAPLSRTDLWHSLGREAEAIATTFPDMPDACTALLQDCAACCFVISGKIVASSAKSDGLVSSLRLALAGATGPASVRDALRVASSPLPRYMFRVEPQFSVELSVSKSKIPSDMSEIGMQFSGDTGHAITVDGVIRNTTRVFKAVELSVSVVWSQEKPSVAARLLCCEKTVGNVVSCRDYTARMSGGTFSIPTMLVFPMQPKQQHLVCLRVALIDAETGKRFENVALETFSYGNLF